MFFRRQLAWRSPAVLWLALLFCCMGLAHAQHSKLDETLSQLEKVRSFSEISISPDGNWVAWVQTSKDRSGNSEIYLKSRNSSAPAVRISAGNGMHAYQEDGIAWSPDSQHFAFLSNAASGQQQVVVATASVAPHRAQTVTHLKGYVTDVRWSPDGKQIAFLYAENGGGGGPLNAVPVQTGVIESELHNQQITVVQASGGEARRISSTDLNVYEYDWSPGADRFAAIAAPGPADNNWWTAQLYVFDAKSGEKHLAYKPPAERQIAVPRWSPDGTRIGFIGGLMSDEGFIGGDIFVTSADGPKKGGGDARNLTPGRLASPSGFMWQNKNRMIFTESVAGGGAIATLDVDNGQLETLWKGDQALHADGNFPNLSLAKDGRMSAVIRSTWEQAPEIWTGPIGDWRQTTHENTGQTKHWGKSESIAWQSNGARVQGWLLYPENFNSSKRYPMIVDIHGGPAGMQSPAWPSARFDMAVMAGMGYFVFMPNPRGSYGGGEAFTKANVKDFGGGDLRDVLAGVDAVLRQVPVDDNRVGVTGWSYGGFMTMWTVTQTHRFRAAVAGAGIADWQSYYGENSIDQWMIPYFGASVYDNPTVYAKSSPITFIKQVKTPTLVVVGERDGECPAPQSFEFWHALKTLGVPTELVVYPGEGHSFHEPKNRVDVLRRTVAWFDKYLNN
jgi:dipeptidyl aminopeptidase/acylaminoacyl peptidase